MPPHKRTNWEFFAVTKGKVTPYFNLQDLATPVASTLWLFPPGYVHGWRGEKGKHCEVAVIHYNSVPHSLAQFVAEHGFLSVRLNTAERLKVARLAASLTPHYWQPVRISEIYTEQVLLELSLLLLRDIKTGLEPGATGAATKKVVSAENWLRNHLLTGPAIAQAARAVGISASQLRRLFWSVRKARPQQILHKLKFERAMEMMANSNIKLANVSAECGFRGASNFCRAFKAYYGTSPAAWRREIYVQYEKPRENQKEDHKSHGRRDRLP